MLIALDARNRHHHKIQCRFRMRLLLQHGKLVLQLKRIFHTDEEFTSDSTSHFDC